MFTYVTLCRNVSKDALGNEYVSNSYLSDNVLILFNTKEEALSAAFDMADEEAEFLNRDADDGVSFNAVTYTDRVTVQYYYNDNTEVVTERIVQEVKQP